MKKLFFVLFSAAAVHFVATFCIAQTAGFTLARIHSDLGYNASWETPLPTEEERGALRQILSQPFYFLGKGGQCFAFASEDGRYVLKFFKHKLRKPWSLLLALPLPEPLKAVRTRKLDKIFYKLRRDFNSYKLAYEELKEETGLMYIHLNKSDSLRMGVTLVDKLGISHRVDLDKVEFLLQKKAVLAYEHLAALKQQHDLEKAKQSIDALLSVILSRCHKGIYDEDARIHRNFGFLGSQAIVIDVGRFVRDAKRRDPVISHADLLTISKQLHAWLQENYPTLIPHLEERLQQAS